MEQIVVGIADCRIAQGLGQVLTTFALGSCIGLAVHDRKAGVGALLHFMLPDSAIDPERARSNPFVFADTGIPLMLQQLFERGANRRYLAVHAVGGALMMDPERVFEIGKRNYQAARKILWKSGLLLSGEAVGGVNCRTVRLEVGSGRIVLVEAGVQRELQTAVAAGPATSTSATPIRLVGSRGGTPWPTVF